MARGTIHETPRVALQKGEAVVSSNRGGRCVGTPTRTTEPLGGAA